MIAFAASAEGTDLYDCARCLRVRTPEWRQRWGCRRLDSDAIAVEPIVITLGDVQLTADHCPGVDVDTPFVRWVIERAEQQSAGYSLGDADTAPAAEVDAVLCLRRMRLLVEAAQADG